MKVLMYSNSDNYETCLLCEPEEPFIGYGVENNEYLNMVRATGDWSGFCMDVTNLINEYDPISTIEAWNVTVLKTYREHSVTIRSRDFEGIISVLETLDYTLPDDFKYIIAGWNPEEKQLYLAMYMHDGPVQIYVNPAEVCEYCDVPFVGENGNCLGVDYSVCNRCVDQAIAEMYSADVGAIVFKATKEDSKIGTLFVRKEDYDNGLVGRIVYVENGESEYNQAKRNLFRVSEEWVKIHPEK